MIEFSNGGVMLTSVPEMGMLPTEGKNAYIDFETTGFDDKTVAVNPWGRCWILGVAIKVDDSRAFYIPVNHVHKQYNFPLEVVKKYLFKLFCRIKRWVNHNVKFDSQVMFRQCGIDLEADVEYACTLEAAKMIDSDRFTFNLTALSRDWLGEDVSKYEKAFEPYLQLTRRTESKDYARVPPDIMGEYACQDVITVAKLWKYCVANMPEVSVPLFATSCRLQRTLIEIERAGVRVDPEKIRVAELHSRLEMTLIQDKLQEKVGYRFEPHISGDCEEVLVDTLGFPVLEWQDKPKQDGTYGAKFSKDALEKYKALPGMDVELIDLILKYRKHHTFVSLFTTQWVELEDKGRLRGTFNPTVRTGRMSMSRPNIQQASKMAKMLLEPSEGCVLICADYSQIEYRVIIHYLNNRAAIEAYLEDPEIDFHVWVAEKCGVDRKPAKTCNFLMGYGGGKKRLVAALVLVAELVAELADQVTAVEETARKREFNALATARATKAYNDYHANLPELKRVSKVCETKCKLQGYVTNKYGRLRRLAPQGAYKAFNNVCQGTSADLMKERLVGLHLWLERYHPYCTLLGVVHDEVALECPENKVTDTLLDEICFVLEDIQVTLRVPIRTKIGASKLHWWDAAEDQNKARDFDRDEMRKTFSEKYPEYALMEV